MLTSNKGSSVWTTDFVASGVFIALHKALLVTWYFELSGVSPQENESSIAHPSKMGGTLLTGDVLYM